MGASADLTLTIGTAALVLNGGELSPSSGNVKSNDCDITRAGQRQPEAGAPGCRGNVTCSMITIAGDGGSMDEKNEDQSMPRGGCGGRRIGAPCSESDVQKPRPTVHILK